MKWLSMDSAPKDGSRILIKDEEGFVYVVSWLNSSEGINVLKETMDWCIPESYQDEQGGYENIYRPVGWMPCPK